MGWDTSGTAAYREWEREQRTMAADERRANPRHPREIHNCHACGWRVSAELVLWLTPAWAPGRPQGPVPMHRMCANEYRIGSGSSA